MTTEIMVRCQTSSDGPPGALLGTTGRGFCLFPVTQEGKPAGAGSGPYLLALTLDGEQPAGITNILSATDPKPLPSTIVRDDEAQLVSAAKAGDTAAFDELVGRYERKIFRLGMNITQNREDAEDVMQEAFLKSFTNLDRFQGDSRFYTWLVRIAVNEALMKLRKRRPNQVSLDEPLTDEDDSVFRQIEDWGPSPEQKFAQTELNGILTEVIGELDPIFRVVFLLRDVESISTEETAQILGISVAAVKSRLLRARLKLRQKLNKYFRRSETQ